MLAPDLRREEPPQGIAQVARGAGPERPMETVRQQAKVTVPVAPVANGYGGTTHAEKIPALGRPSMTQDPFIFRLYDSIVLR